MSLLRTVIGVAKDAEQAVSWYRRAAEGGPRRCAVQLGQLCYSTGDGVAKDADQAASWFRCAADAGRCRCSIHLGQSATLMVTVLPRMQSRQCRGTAVQLMRAMQKLNSAWAITTLSGDGVAKDADASCVVVPPCS